MDKSITSKVTAAVKPAAVPPQDLVDEFAHVRTSRLIEIADAMKNLDERHAKRVAEIPIGMRGVFRIEHPDRMSLDDITDCEEFLTLLFRRLRRGATAPISSRTALDQMKDEATPES